MASQIDCVLSAFLYRIELAASSSRRFQMYIVVQFCVACQPNIHVERFITWLGYWSVKIEVTSARHISCVTSVIRLSTPFYTQFSIAIIKLRLSACLSCGRTKIHSRRASFCSSLDSCQFAICGASNTSLIEFCYGLQPCLAINLNKCKISTRCEKRGQLAAARFESIVFNFNRNRRLLIGILPPLLALIQKTGS